jgi:hypothetical protein
MEALREITDWASPNHTYLLDGNNLVAYIKQSETEAYYFKQPIKGFDKRGRKFVSVTPSPFGNRPVLTPVNLDIQRVQGSKPNVWYEVNQAEGTCSCPGFTFRGHCKHVKQAVDALANT